MLDQGHGIKDQVHINIAVIVIITIIIILNVIIKHPRAGVQKDEARRTGLDTLSNSDTGRPRGRQLIRDTYYFLPFHAPVLVPGFHLELAEPQRFGQVYSAGERERRSGRQLSSRVAASRLSQGK